jgi:succinate dehydrogenase / fumarate reductase iron-sulfur subunit
LREGICGTCGLVINGLAHGPLKGVTACQLHMRTFNDGETLTIEPWRAKNFQVIKDLAVDRQSFDRIMEAGGYISVKTGGAPDANAMPIFKENADEAFDSATCIGCGACVAACKNSSAMLFVGAEVNQYAQLPQGQVEHSKRVKDMVEAMDQEGFGNCTNTGACEAECPKEISIDNIIKLNNEYLKFHYLI